MSKDRLTVSSETRPNCNHILETAISPGGTAFDVLQLDATADASVRPLMCMPSSSQSVRQEINHFAAHGVKSLVVDRDL
jgi:hypothetical protein